MGDLGGGVFDVDTGAPLPYANVLLADASIGTSTNEDGLFRFASLLTGAYPVTVTYIGYRPQTDTVYVESGATNRQRFYLRADEVEIEPIVVDGLSQRLPSQSLGEGDVSGEDLVAFNGAPTPDVIRGASRLIGVATQQPIADLYIQGGAGNEHVTVLDGAVVRNPVSMGRHLGAFSPLALERIAVQKAGFEARFGSHLTGRVAVDHSLSTRAPLSSAFMIDPVSVNGRLHGRAVGSQGQEAVFMVAGRSSNWDVYQDRDVHALLEQWSALDPLVASQWTGANLVTEAINQYTEDPDVQFSDLHLASRIKLNPFHVIHASAYRAINELSSIQIAESAPVGGEDDLYFLSQNAYSWRNWAAQLRHSWLPGSRSILTSQLRGSWHDSSLNYRAFLWSEGIEGAPLPQVMDVYRDSLNGRVHAAERNKIDEFAAQTTLHHSWSSTHEMEAGLEAYRVSSDFAFFQAFIDEIKTEPTTWMFSGYLQHTFSVGSQLQLVPGLRATYVPELQAVYAEPRMALRYDGASPAVGDYAFRLAGGMYRQFVNQFELTTYGTSTIVPSALFWLPLDESVSPPRSYHLALDALLLPSPEWTFRMESYAKWHHRLLTLDYATIQDLEPGSAFLQQEAFVTSTRGRAFGASIAATYAPRWATIGSSYDYSYVVQRFPGRFEDAMIRTPWHVPHRFNVNLSLNLSSQWKLETAWTQSSGRTWAFRQSYYDIFTIWRPDPITPLPGFQNPEEDTIPQYKRLDVGARYRVDLADAGIEMRIMVINALDTNNIYDYSVESDGQQYNILPRTLPGRQLALSLRVDY